MSDEAPLSGRNFGRYQLLQLVAVSGQGVVYRAWDPKLQCIVAIKRVSEDTIPDESARLQLQEEARIAASLDDPRICKIKDFIDEDSQAGIVMEFVEGRTLTSVIPANEGLNLDLVVGYGIEIANAVGHAHERGVIHRDLKSGNVMVTRDGNIKLLDFGLSKIQRRTQFPAPSRTASTESSAAIAGTPPYWAPEVLKHCPIDTRSDIWSFGVLLYEMATGQMPFKGANLMDLGHAILYDAPSPLPEGVPDFLSTIISRCLCKQIEHRYQQIYEPRFALEAIEKMRGKSQPRRTPGVIFPIPVIRSVAVLPLENLSGIPDQEYFADGLTESLITALAKLGELRVISRTSVMLYKRAPKPIPQIARELGVDAVVEGSVRRDGDRIRITAELIEASTDQHLWTETYDRDLRDILSLQTQVASAIASEIRAKLRPSRATPPLVQPSAPGDAALDPSLYETVDSGSVRLNTVTSVNPKAYDLYLRGRHFWNNQVSDEDFRKAVEYYERAIEIDPQSALTYAGLAHCLLLMGTGEYGFKPPSEIMPKAKQAALKALKIDDSIAEAHLSLAMVKFRFDWDWEGAEREFKRTIELSPGYSVAHSWYSVYLLVLGRFDEAFAEAMMARKLSPLSPVMHFSLGLLLYASGQTEEAIEQLRQTVVMGPRFPLSHLVLGLTFGRKGRFDEAIDAFKQALAIGGARPLWSGYLGQVYALAGQSQAAVEILHELHEASKQRYVPSVAFAIVYAGLGMIDDAFRWLDKAVNERDGLLIYLKVGSVFDNLRSDRRFAGILARVGLQGNPDLEVQHPKPSPSQEAADAPVPAKDEVAGGLNASWSPWRFLQAILAVAVLIGAIWGAKRIYDWCCPPRLTLVVEHFKTLGNDSEERRMAEIVSEEIFTRLSELHPQRVGVVELTASDSELSFEKVCDLHKASYLLAGAIRHSGPRAVITNQLVSCNEETSVIGDRHDTDSNGSGLSLAVDDIVRRILAALPQDVQQEHAVNPKAYDAYLQGRFEWNRRTTQSLTAAIADFQTAIGYDESYAPSYAGLADCYALLASAPYTALSPNEAFPKAKVNARKALDLDSNLAEAHVALAYSALVYDRDYAESEKEFKKALELRPGYATAHQYYAYYLTAMGKLDEAIAERKRAVDLEPSSPLLKAALGEAYYQAHKFDESISYNQEALSLDSHYVVAVINVGRSLEQKKMYPQAFTKFQAILAYAPDDPVLLAFRGHNLAVSGKRGAALKTALQLEQMRATKYVPGLYIALVYTGLGDKNAAFNWLKKAYEERCEYLVYLPSEPLADPLRGDPRFDALLQRLGLAKINHRIAAVTAQ